MLRALLALANRVVARAVLGHADAVLFVSPVVREYFAALTPRGSAFVEVPNGLDTARFSPAPLQRSAELRASLGHFLEAHGQQWFEVQRRRQQLLDSEAKEARTEQQKTEAKIQALETSIIDLEARLTERASRIASADRLVAMLTDFIAAGGGEIDTQKVHIKSLARNAETARDEQARASEQLEQLEKQMAQQQARLVAIETQLADTQLYEAAQKQRLQELLAEQGTLRRQQDETETGWLDVQDQLEQQTRILTGA